MFLLCFNLMILSLVKALIALPEVNVGTSWQDSKESWKSDDSQGSRGWGVETGDSGSPGTGFVV